MTHAVASDLRARTRSTHQAGVHLAEAAEVNRPWQAEFNGCRFDMPMQQVVSVQRIAGLIGENKVNSGALPARLRTVVPVNNPPPGPEIFATQDPNDEPASMLLERSPTGTEGLHPHSTAFHGPERKVGERVGATAPRSTPEYRAPLRHVWRHPMRHSYHPGQVIRY